MKYVIVRCEDGARRDRVPTPLLESAKTVHLQHLAHAGAAGVLHPYGNDPRVDRFEFHRALCGLAPDEPSATPAQCYAAAAKLQLTEQDTAWCCEFMTHRDGTIVDSSAGNIPTKESEVLVRALNERLSSTGLRWELGRGPHHILVARDESLRPQAPGLLRGSELLVGRPWKQFLPSGSLGEALTDVLEASARVLEEHPVNRVRIDLGENPANMLWLWGAAAQAAAPIRQREKQAGAVVSNSFALQGFAACLGLDWRPGPISFEEPALRDLMRGLATLVERRERIYLHMQVDSPDPVERLCAMERIDQVLLKPLTDLLPRLGAWRLLVAMDDCADGSVPFVAIGTGLPKHPAARLDRATLQHTPLSFDRSGELHAWWTGSC